MAKTESLKVTFSSGTAPASGVALMRSEPAGLRSIEWFSLEEAQNLLAELKQAIRDAGGKP